MLNGIDPIILFNFFKVLTPDEVASISKIPIVSSVYDKIGLPPIPIYLSEKLTGLLIDSEDKSIDIETTVETLPNGTDPKVTQKGINSTVKINIVAVKESIGMTLLSALADLIFAKVTSREYSITYLHGAVTVFGGLLHSFSINQNAEDTKYNITIELSRSTVKTIQPVAPPFVNKLVGAVPL